MAAWQKHQAVHGTEKPGKWAVTCCLPIGRDLRDTVVAVYLQSRGQDFKMKR